MSDADTLIQDDPQLDPALQDDPDAPGGADEPFLKVSDRQVYKTREEAIKGYEEASKMGATFGEIRKVAKEFGLQNLEPQLLRQLFSELVTHRTEKAKPAAKPTEPTVPAGKSNVTPEIEAARQWLKENAKEAGYVSKEDVEALAKELAELKGGLSSKDAEQRDSLISEGQEAVSGWIKEAKDASGNPISLNDDERAELEENMASWINGKQERINQFYKGGTTSLNLVKQAYTRELTLLKPGVVISPNPAAKVAASGKTKTELISRNPKKMPNDGSGKGAPGAAKVSERIGSPTLHAKAVAMLRARLAEGNGN